MKLASKTVAVELRVKVKLNQEKNFEPLITSFFQNFNPENSLTISGSESDLTLVFTEPPMEIIKAIGTYENIELSYTGQHPEDNTSGCDTTSDTSNLSSAKETNAENSKPQVETQPTKPIRRTRASVVDSAINIPALKNIAKETESFDGFLLAIEEWLEINRHQKVFEDFALASIQVSKVSWVNIDAALASKGITYSIASKSYLVKKVYNKLNTTYSVSLLSLLAAIAYYYRNSSFKDDSVSSEEKTANAEETTTAGNPSTAEESITVEEPAAAEESAVEHAVSEPSVVKMECMPEIEDFQEVLAHIDKTQPVEKQIQYVLNAMGLSTLPANVQNQILEIATIAVKDGITGWDSVFIKSIIPTEESSRVRVTFSSLVNDYIKKYVKGHKVKLVRFLSDLQKVING